MPYPPPATCRQNETNAGQREGNSEPRLGVPPSPARYRMRPRSLPKHGYIAAFRQFDDQRIAAALACVILDQPGPKPPGFRSDDGVPLGIVIRFAAEHLHRDQGFLNLLVP